MLQVFLKLIIKGFPESKHIKYLYVIFQIYNDIFEDTPSALSLLIFTVIVHSVVEISPMSNILFEF